MLMQAAREEPGDDAEILVVMRREPPRVALGFLDCASLRREVARDFKFGCGQHGAGLLKRQGMIAVFGVPFRFFICSNTRGSSVRGASPVIRSLARISPRAIVARASRMKRGV